MTSTVWVLTVLAAIGGLIQIPGAWELVSDWLNPVAEPLVEPSLLQDYATSAVSVALGLAGIGLAWWIYGSAARPSFTSRLAWARRPLEHKLYFDEAYDWVFYRPSVLIANAWARFVERPLIAGSIEIVADGTRRAGGGVSQTQTGLVRSYALAIAFGVAVLLLVFLTVR